MTTSRTGSVIGCWTDPVIAAGEVPVIAPNAGSNVFFPPSVFHFFSRDRPSHDGTDLNSFRDENHVVSMIAQIRDGSDLGNFRDEIRLH